MLLGFKRRFAPFVLDGSKTHTIRGLRERAPKVGEMCHCYVDPRQKTMALLGRWECVKVDEITIGLGRVEEWPDGTYKKHVLPVVYVAHLRLAIDEMDLLAWRDGFRHPCDGDPRVGLGYRGCFKLMMEFWDGRLPFRGHMIHWRFEQAARNPKWEEILERIGVKGGTL